MGEVVPASERVINCIQRWIDDHQGAAPAAHRLAVLAIEIARQAALLANRRLTTLTGGGQVDMNSVRALHKHLGSCNALFELLEHSSRDSLHPVLSPMVQGQLTALEVIGDVLVTSVRDNSYELLTIRQTEYGHLVRTAYLNTFVLPIFVFRVPHPPADWSLYHILLFHEIGHATFLERGVTKMFLIPDELQPKSEGAQLLFDRNRQHYYEMCANSWYEELFADVIGLELSGPGYVLAFCRVLGGGGGLNAGSATHPPAGLRILLMLDSLEYRGLIDELPAKVKAMLRAWHATVKQLDARANYTVSDKSDNDLRIIMGLLVKAMKESYTGLQAQARTIVPDYTAARVQEDLRRGKFLHELRIPPIEINGAPGAVTGSPLASPQIFASCWAAYMLSLEASSAAMDVFEKALLESLDAAESLRRWIATQ